MPTARLSCDVDDSEEAELRWLEVGLGESMEDGSATFSGAVLHGCGQRAAATPATSTEENQAAFGQAEARQTLVSGYAEHRASLNSNADPRLYGQGCRAPTPAGLVTEITSPSEVGLLTMATAVERYTAS